MYLLKTHTFIHVYAHTHIHTHTHTHIYIYIYIKYFDKHFSSENLYIYSFAVSIYSTKVKYSMLINVNI